MNRVVNLSKSSQNLQIRKKRVRGATREYFFIPQTTLRPSHFAKVITHFHEPPLCVKYVLTTPERFRAQQWGVSVSSVRFSEIREAPPPEKVGSDFGEIHTPL